MGSFKSANLVTQANPFFPLIFIASEPQTPSRQDILIDSEASVVLIFIKASKSITSVLDGIKS